MKGVYFGVHILFGGILCYNYFSTNPVIFCTVIMKISPFVIFQYILLQIKKQYKCIQALKVYRLLKYMQDQHYFHSPHSLYQQWHPVIVENHQGSKAVKKNKSKLKSRPRAVLFNINQKCTNIFEQHKIMSRISIIFSPHSLLSTASSHRSTHRGSSLGLEKL